MKNDELMVLGLAGIAVFFILKTGGIKLPTIATVAKKTGTYPRKVNGITIDDNSAWSSTGRPWFDPYAAAVDGGFIPQGL